MIYILTGIAKSGKSLIAREIQQRYQLSVFSTDHIMMMLHHGNPDIDLDIDASDHTVAKILEPYITGLIKSMITNKQEYIIEGVHFNPDFGRYLVDLYPNDIRILYIGYQTVSVEDKVAELYRYKEDIHNPWIFDHLGESVESIVAYMISESKRISKECSLHNLPYCDITDINTQMDSIIELLMNRIK